MDGRPLTPTAHVEQDLMMPHDSDQIDGSVRVVTPENISFLYEVAGPFRRLPAYLIDLMIRFGLAAAAVVASSLLGIVAGALAFGPMLLAWFVLEWFYGGLFETFWNGQTPGKRLTGIRVLSVEGKPVNGLQAILRNILRAVDLMPVVPAVALGLPDIPLGIPTLMIGLVTAAWNDRYQRMGDLVCGTMVIVEQRGGSSIVAKMDDPRAAELAACFPISFQIDQKLSRALSAYVERRKSFLAARRHEIACRLAEPLLQQFSLPADTSHDLFLCALYHRAYVVDHDDSAESDLMRDSEPPQLLSAEKGTEY
jgi:uncharacterized RDD family membrane protein YckC